MKYFVILKLVDSENLLKIPRESLVNNSLYLGYMQFKLLSQVYAIKILLQYFPLANVFFYSKIYNIKKTELILNLKLVFIFGN